MAETLSLPSLALLLLLSFLAFRYFVSSSSSSSSSPSSSTSQAGSRGPQRPINLAAVDQVASMFPQLDRRVIAWDLQRNGGSANATVERVLGGRTLDEPPPSFRPAVLTAAASAASSSSTTPGTAAGGARAATTTTSTPTAAAPLHPDLITRFKLQEKVRAAAEADADGTDEAEALVGGKSTSSWASTKAERAANLLRRREEMIVRARRKMEVRDRREEKGKEAVRG